MTGARFQPSHCQTARGGIEVVPDRHFSFRNFSTCNGHSRCGKISVGDGLVARRARLNSLRPTDEEWHAVTRFPNIRFRSPQRSIRDMILFLVALNRGVFQMVYRVRILVAVHVGSVIRGVEDQSVASNPLLIGCIQNTTNHFIYLNHEVPVRPQPTTALLTAVRQGGLVRSRQRKIKKERQGSLITLHNKVGCF